MSYVHNDIEVPGNSKTKIHGKIAHRNVFVVHGMAMQRNQRADTRPQAKEKIELEEEKVNEAADVRYSNVA